MIREEAIDDEKYVQEYCKKYNIECFVKRADVQKIASEKKIGTEEAGRKVRYDFFEEVLQKTESNKIAIAHNKNDKIETIIMHLLRGSGLSGLKGIEPIRDNKYIHNDGYPGGVRACVVWPVCIGIGDYGAFHVP